MARSMMESTARFERAIGLLQSPAFPLGYVDMKEPARGFEPPIFAFEARCISAMLRGQTYGRRDTI